jgi:hypothetical protein
MQQKRPIVRAAGILLALLCFVTVAEACCFDCHGDHSCDCAGFCSHICTCATYDPITIEPVLRHSAYTADVTTDLPETISAGIFRPPKPLL